MKWMDELITAIYELNEWIDYCNVWNEWMNLLLQCTKWIYELITAIMKLMDELIAAMY